MITISHGSGGLHSLDLVLEVFKPYFGDIMPYYNEDSALFSDIGIGVTSTDSYIINPIFFRGGNIGKLSICGSSNDVAMMGGKPMYINIGFIIEEGFLKSDLKKIASSIAKECKALNMQILSADTKVLPRISSNNPQIFINTTCIGKLEKKGISAANIVHGDSIILSGKIGNHGANIFLEQNNIDIENHIESDCASLYPMLEPLFKSDIPLHALRDATRGGIASTLNEFAMESNVSIEINEEDIEIDSNVRGVCEILGLEPFVLANEGVCVLALPKEYANSAVEILKRHKLGENARIIGFVNANDDRYRKKVLLNTGYGSKRFLEYPDGEILPRIC